MITKPHDAKGTTAYRPIYQPEILRDKTMDDKLMYIVQIQNNWWKLVYTNQASFNKKYFDSPLMREYKQKLWVPV